MMNRKDSGELNDNFIVSLTFIYVHLVVALSILLMLTNMRVRVLLVYAAIA